MPFGWQDGSRALPQAVADRHRSHEAARHGYARGMPVVDVPLTKIADWESFHMTFAATLGFPGFYGRNMNAWIDSLTLRQFLNAAQSMSAS
jgi:hypothetical protein